MGKLVTGTESYSPPSDDCTDKYLFDIFSIFISFLLVLNGSLTGLVIPLRDTLSPLLITFKRTTLPLSVAWNTKKNQIYNAFFTLNFLPVAFSPHFIIIAGKIFQVILLNLTKASVWKAQAYLQRLRSCCLSLTAFADLQFRIKVVSSVTSNELLSRMSLNCINLPSTMLQIQALLSIWWASCLRI